MGNRDCDLHLGTARKGKKLVSMPSELLLKALLGSSHWARLLEYHRRRHQ